MLRCLPLLLAAAFVLAGCETLGFTPPGEPLVLVDDDDVVLPDDDDAGDDDVGDDDAGDDDVGDDDAGDDDVGDDDAGDDDAGDDDAGDDDAGDDDAGDDDAGDDDAGDDDVGDDDTTPPPQESCTGGQDEDGDGLTDCADPDCANHSACSGSACTAFDSVGVGDSVSWASNGFGSSDVVDSWACEPGRPMTGNEVVYSFTAPSTGLVEVSIEYVWVPFTTELDVFVLDGSGPCVSSACLFTDTGLGPDVVTWSATAGSSWYIVVDGWSESTGLYTLNVTMP